MSGHAHPYPHHLCLLEFFIICSGETARFPRVEEGFIPLSLSELHFLSGWVLKVSIRSRMGDRRQSWSWLAGQDMPEDRWRDAPSLSGQ